MRSLINQIQVKRAISPLSFNDNTPQVSQIIDRQGYDSLAFLILTGNLADPDATFTVLIEEGDQPTLTDAVAVADIDMVPQQPGSIPEIAAGFQFDDDNEVRKIAYIGTKRYVRLTILPANNGGAALVAAVALLGHAEQKPVVQAQA